MDFYEHLKTYLSENDIAKLKNSLKDKDTHALLLNLNKISKDDFIKMYPLIKPHPIINNAFLYNPEIYEFGKSLLYELGCFYLQDPAAMLPAYLLNANEKDLVLDLCAAPGGKSIQSSYLMNNKGLIVANDLSYERACSIKENVEKLGIGNILITSNDFSKIYNKYLNTFTKIILDAPCSGSGMFRKNNKMLLDWSINKVIKCVEKQKELITMCYKMLKPGGTLLYSTCSFSKEEDEDIVTYLLNNSDAEILPIDNNLLFKKGYNNVGIHLLPYIYPGEGQYICLIKKPGNLIYNENEKKNVNSLIKHFDIKTDYNFVSSMKEFTFLISKEFDVKGLNIIRYGVLLGEINKNIIKYSLHYARYITSFNQVLEINKEQLNDYLYGNSLSINGIKGYVLLTYLNIPIDIAKGDNRIIKNRYPKYLKNKKYYL